MRDAMLMATAERVCLSLLARRGAQIDRGYDAAHDDEHSDGAIVTDRQWGVVARLDAAASYEPDAPERREALAVAASLLVAEIERIDRARERLSAAEA